MGESINAPVLVALFPLPAKDLTRRSELRRWAASWILTRMSVNNPSRSTDAGFDCTYDTLRLATPLSILMNGSVGQPLRVLTLRPRES